MKMILVIFLLLRTNLQMNSQPAIASSPIEEELPEHPLTEIERSLNAHIEAIHDNDNITYSCDQCEYKATQKLSLRTHIKSLHEDFTCDQCEFKEKRKGQLDDHIESIHENVTYSCNQCEYKVTRKSNLKTWNCP